jgi:ubiquinone/menaquinone biosynthesis C-methylase UbiE
MANEYIQGLQANKEIAEEYYRKSIVKTEQQKMLESILSEEKLSPQRIADIACGGGSLSFHLSQLYPQAHFHLSDLNPEALEMARNTCTGEQFEFSSDDIYNLQGLGTESYDCVFCWQTLSWIDEPQKALEQLLGITKKGGRIYLSALFNLEHELDLFVKVKDHTRKGESMYTYNTYASSTINNWIGKKVSSLKFYPFHPSIDFNYDGKGLGTYTVEANGKRLQLSAGMLLNWAILEVVK